MKHNTTYSFSRVGTLLLMIALFFFLPPSAIAETSPQLAWLDRTIEMATTCDFPLDCDGSLWKTYHSASDDEYYGMLLRKSEDANWDLFTRAGAGQIIDGVDVGDGIYRYLGNEPYESFFEEAHGYELFDYTRLHVHPQDSSQQLLFILLAGYYYGSPEDSSVREQSFEEFAFPLLSGDVRLLNCEPYDWMTNGYEFGAASALAYTETDDYYLFECAPEGGGEPIQLLIRDYAYYDAWNPMSSREEIEGPVVQTDLYGSGNILTTQVDVRVLNLINKFKVDVYYDNATEEGSIDVIITVDFYHGNDEYPVDSVEDVQIALDGKYGFVPSETLIDLGTITEPVIRTVRYDYHDPDGLIHPSTTERPTVLFQVTGKDIESYDYSIEMDVQPQARLLSIYRYMESDKGGSEVLKQSNDDIQKALKKQIYDGQPMISFGVKITDTDTGKANEAPYIDDPKALWLLEDCETDDNDITYIYLATHGQHTKEGEIVSTISFPKRPSIINDEVVTEAVDYSEILDYIEKHVKGRVVLLIDACYSGIAIEKALEISIDTKRYFVATGTTSYYSEVTGLFESMKLAQLVDKASKGYEYAECGRLEELSKEQSEVSDANWYKGFMLLADITEYELMSYPSKIDYFIEVILSDEKVKDNKRLKEFRNDLESSVNMLIMPHFSSEQIDRTIIDQIATQITSRIKKEEKIRDVDWVSDRAWYYLDSAWWVNEPQFYGNEKLPLIFNDPDFDDHYRLPVPLEDTIKSSDSEAG